MNKKIIVTGGSGFIGSNLIHNLIKKKYIILNLDCLNYASVPDKFKPFVNSKNYKLYKYNINNKLIVQNILKKNKIDGIINLASLSHVDRSINTPEKFILQNISTNLSFIEEVNFYKKKNIFNGKFINISTDEVYGSIDKIASDENFPLMPNSPYSASKASVDHILRAYNQTYDFPFINIRCCYNYGPFQFPEKFIPTIILNLLNNDQVPLYGNGLNKREWIHVNDFSEAIELIFKKGKINNIYNVGSGQRFTNILLVNIIKKIFEDKYNKKFRKDFIKFVKDRPGHDHSYKINSKKIRKNLKWNNTISLKTGLEQTIHWYLNNSRWIQYTKKKYKGERLGNK